MSVRPEWVAMLESGLKLAEVRKTAIQPPPKADEPIKCYVYETKAAGRGRGQIVGWFLCEEIMQFAGGRRGKRALYLSCMTAKQMKEYKGERPYLYAWLVSAQGYHKIDPVPLASIHKGCAPQSWCSRAHAKGENQCSE